MVTSSTEVALHVVVVVPQVWPAMTVFLSKRLRHEDGLVALEINALIKKVLYYTMIIVIGVEVVRLKNLTTNILLGLNGFFPRVSFCGTLNIG